MSYAQKQADERQPDAGDHHRCAHPLRARLRARHRTGLQRDQEGGRGPEDVRRRGRAAAPRESRRHRRRHAGHPAAAADVAPPPLVRTTSAPPPIQSTPVAPPPVITRARAPPAPPAAAAAAQDGRADRARAATSQGLFSADDYPPSARRRGEQGTVARRADDRHQRPGHGLQRHVSRAVNGTLDSTRPAAS